MYSLHVDFGEACGFYNRSNGGVRQKLKTGSQCESVLLRCLTPARLIRMKQITSDEALSNQLLRLYHKSASGLRKGYSDYKNNPQAFEEINTRKGALLRRKNYVWSTP